jgi:excisionase family DNA binding protein
MTELETIATTTVKAPGRPRSPLARQIAQTFETKRTLFSDPLLSLAEFRLAAGSLSYSHVRRLIAEKKISVWRPYPKAHMKIRLSEVQRFLASGDSQEATS